MKQHEYKSEVWLQNKTWIEIDSYLKHQDIIIFPIGATEQHGPAAAIGLDTYNALHLAEDLAKERGLLVAPPLWYGDSSHHTGFPGTISLRSETLIAVMKDIFRSLLKHRFRKILVINGHKISNLPALTIAAKDIHEYEHPESIIALADPWKIARGVASKIKGDTVEHHAGLLEVSQLFYKRPDLVRQEELSSKDVAYGDIFSKWSSHDLFGKPLSENGDTVDVVWNSAEQRAFAESGQFSDNSKSDPDLGKVYHDYMVNVLVEFVDWLKDYKGPLGSAGVQK